MDGQEVLLTIEIVKSVLINGPKMVTAIAALFDGGEDPTPEQIQALKIDDKPFFDEES